MFLRLVAVFCLFVCLIVGCTSQQKLAQAPESDWVQLFNGKDLTGWDIKIAGFPVNENYKNTFRVHDSMISIAYDQYKTFDEHFGHLYYNKPFSYYLLKFQYRFTGVQTPGGASWNNRNSGVMIHSQSAQSNSLNQDFPVSLEVQLLGGLGKGVRHTGNLCTPGTQVHINGRLSTEHCVDSDSKTYDGDQWVSMTVVVLGDSIVHHIVETDTVLTYQKTEVGGGFVSSSYDFKTAHIENEAYWKERDATPLSTGYIALQAESHPIDFKNIQLLNLEGCTDRKAKNFKSYYIKSNNSTCLY